MAAMVMVMVFEEIGNRNRLVNLAEDIGQFGGKKSAIENRNRVDNLAGRYEFKLHVVHGHF